MARIYVASSWRNAFQPSVVEMLRFEGHDVYDFRNPFSGLSGFQWSELDANWEKWTARDYRDKLLTHPRAAQGYVNDLRAMEWADTCVMVLPCGNSAHIEAGWMAGRGKHTIIYIPEGTEFKPDLMYLCADHIVVDENELKWAITPPGTSE